MFSTIRRAKRAGKSQNQTPRNQIGPAERGLKRRDAGIRGNQSKFKIKWEDRSEDPNHAARSGTKSIRFQNQMGGSRPGARSAPGKFWGSFHTRISFPRNALAAQLAAKMPLAAQPGQSRGMAAWRHRLAAWRQSLAARRHGGMAAKLGGTAAKSGGMAAWRHGGTVAAMASLLSLLPRFTSR